MGMLGQIQSYGRDEGASQAAIKKALDKAKKRYEQYPHMKLSVENWLSSIGQRCFADETLLSASNWITSDTQFDCVKMFEEHQTEANFILERFEIIAMYTHSEKAMTEVAKCITLLHVVPDIATKVAEHFAMKAMTTQSADEVMHLAKECLEGYKSGAKGEQQKKTDESTPNEKPAGENTNEND